MLATNKADLPFQDADRVSARRPQLVIPCVPHHQGHQAKAGQHRLKKGQLDFEGMLLCMGFRHIPDHRVLFHERPDYFPIQGNIAKRGTKIAPVIDGYAFKSMVMAWRHHDDRVEFLILQKLIGMGRDLSGIAIPGMGRNECHQAPGLFMNRHLL